MNRDDFFAELDQLTPKEIEARLPSWDKDKLARSGVLRANTLESTAD